MGGAVKEAGVIVGRKCNQYILSSHRIHELFSKLEMTQRISMAVYHAMEMSQAKKEQWDGAIITVIIEGENYCIECPASLKINERMPFPRGEGDAPGLYDGDGVWLMSNPPKKNSTKNLNSSKNVRAPVQLTHNLPLATSEPLTGKFHDTPRPFSIKNRPIDVRLKFSGRGVPEVRDIVIKQQIIELPEKGGSLVKHFLGGRISFRMVKTDWDGPFISIMTPESRKKYLDSFESIDIDESGCLNQAELLKMFTKHNYGFTAKDVAQLVKRYSTSVPGEVTFNDYCEMMEAEGCAGKAWFIAGIRAVVPEGGFEQVMMSSDELLFGRLAPIFRESFEINDSEKSGMLVPEKVAQAFATGCERIGVQASSAIDAVGGLQFNEAMTMDDFLGLLGAEPFRSTLTAMHRARFKILNAERSKDLIEFRARAKLVRVKGTFVRVTTQLVVCSHASLNSGDVFMLDCDSRIYLWLGKEANEHEIIRGQELAANLCIDRSLDKPIQVKDGSESADFWFILGGKGPVAEAIAGVSDEIAEGLREPTSSYPSPRKDKPRCAVIGSGVSGSICAREVMKNSGIEVVVFESSGTVGGRLGSVVRNGVPFTAGAAYFCAAGPHMKRHLQELISCGVITQWFPRVGILTSFSTGTDVSPGFIPALHTVESEVNIEAWLEARPKTGTKRHSRASLRPATAFCNPVENIPLYDLPAPDLLHRRSHAQSFAQGHGSQTWYLCKPDMSELTAYLLDGISVHRNKRVQAIIPKLGQGVYEIVMEDAESHELSSAGCFDFVLVCTPPNEVSRLLRDVQPSLSKIPDCITMLPVWVVLVSFDHPVPSPHDVLFCEDPQAFEPIQAIFRESSRYSSYDPGKDNFETDSANLIQHRVWERPHRIGPLWGWGRKTPIERHAPSTTVHGGPLDSWALHLDPTWSDLHRNDFAPEIAEKAISKFLSLLGLQNAKFRVVVSEAVLWEHGALLEPASVHAMKPGADLAFGPYCIFDPATGIGMAGDWCVESSVEGAFVSGLELAARVCKSPIIHHQGVSNPFGRVQFELQQAMHHRARKLEGAEVVSGYSSDSRPSTCFDDKDLDLLDWEDRALLQNLQRNHINFDGNDISFVRKTKLCEFEGCQRWIDIDESEQHCSVCPFRPCAKCPFLECGIWVHSLESHMSTCKVTKVECDWCFVMIPSPALSKHQKQCIARPGRIAAYADPSNFPKTRAVPILPSLIQNIPAKSVNDAIGPEISVYQPSKAGPVTFDVAAFSQTEPISKDARSNQSRDSSQSRAKTRERRE